MKQGFKTIQELYQKLEEQRENRKDMIADTRSLIVNSADGISSLSVSTGDDVKSYVVSDVAHRQIADRLGIPFKYYDRMRLEYPKVNCDISNPQLLVGFGQLVTGYCMKRNLIWCSHGIAKILELLLRAALPDAGAIQELPVSASKPEFRDAASSDSNCVILKISTAADLSAMFFSKLMILAESQKPVLVATDCMPFMPDGVNADDAIALQKSLRIINDMTNEELRQIDFSNVDSVSAFVSDSLGSLADLVNSIEGDICPAAESLLQRADPNKIKEMLKKLFEDEINDTGDSSDVIPVQVLTEKLKGLIVKAGGDGTKVTVNGVGKYLKDLNIRKDNIKLHGCKGKVSAVIGYQRKNLNWEVNKDVNR